MFVWLVRKFQKDAKIMSRTNDKSIGFSKHGYSLINVGVNSKYAMNAMFVVAIRAGGNSFSLAS